MISTQQAVPEGGNYLITLHICLDLLVFAALSVKELQLTVDIMTLLSLQSVISYNSFSRPYWVVRSRLWYDVLSVCSLSVCRLSVTFCIVAKRYVVEGQRWYRWIGRW